MSLPKKRRPISSAQPQALKRQRPSQEDEAEQQGFAAELAEMFDDEFSQGTDIPLKNVAPTDEAFESFKNWARPAFDNGIGIDTKTAIFMQMFDMDHFIESDHVVMRIFGVTKGGHSICAMVHGFRPYLYVRAPDCLLPEHLESVHRKLDSLVRNTMGGPNNSKQTVVDVDLIWGESLYGYDHDEKSPFLKITVTIPRLVPIVRKVCENGVKFDFMCNAENLRSFEANIDFEVRFMVDSGIVGCCWLEIPAGMYEIVAEDRRKTRTQLEVSLHWETLIVHSPEGDWADISPLRILSFDIECAGRKGVFPEADKDPVIQIANMVMVQGESRTLIRNVFTLNTCAPIVGSHVLSFDKEDQLLEHWADFVRRTDPDIITGYNIQNFDIPYILDRAKHLNVPSVAFLGRVRDRVSRVRDVALQSRQMGHRVNKQTNIEGRIQFDLLQVLLRDYKLRSYTLNSVSFHFLREQKEDVQHSIITDLQNGDEQSRRRLAVYCLKDAYLPIRLLDKLMSIVNYVEMARVSGVPLSYLLSRGQQIKVISQLLRKTKARSVFLPVIESNHDAEAFEGATVIEPMRGFYNEPIATLDFASLYPSIMMAHNLCYTTLVGPKARARLAPCDYIQTPSGNFFVTGRKRAGLLPEILDDLLSARKKAKGELKLEQNPFRRMVLDGRQLALKISANSVYGFTGAVVGKLPCVEISQSVTSFGRQMIELTKNSIERLYVQGGNEGKCPVDAKVIYGDTDSVMVKFGIKTVAEAMELGRHAAMEISKLFLSPIRLEFEKVYFPFLLINKKRYAGLYFTVPDKYDKMDCKGLETVRRDNCPLVASVLNTCLDKLLIQRSAEGALKFAKETISDLLCNRIDISQLIISKELTKKEDKYQAKQAHVVLAERMRKRDAGSAPRLGDRVPYVLVAGGKNAAAYSKAEDPIYVLENGIPIDTTFYLEHQLAKPLTRIFEPILGDRAEIALTKGEHTRVKSTASCKVGGLAAFATRKFNCLGCKAVLNGNDATCLYCRPKIGEIYQREIYNLQSLERKFGRLWTECQRCSGSLLEEVLCTARDCPIFYMREKVRFDLKTQSEVLERFGEPTMGAFVQKNNEFV